jgi:hypothetical protein
MRNMKWYREMNIVVSNYWHRKLKKAPSRHYFAINFFGHHNVWQIFYYIPSHIIETHSSENYIEVYGRDPEIMDFLSLYWDFSPDCLSEKAIQQLGYQEGHGRWPMTFRLTSGPSRRCLLVWPVGVVVIVGTELVICWCQVRCTAASLCRHVISLC